MEFTNSTTYLLSEVANKYRTEFEKIMNEVGLHSGQVFVLQLVFSQDGQSQVDLAAALNLSAPTVNNMVKSLEKNGFIVCQKCEFDRRLVRVYLSEKAVVLKEAINKRWEKFDKDFFSPLTATEKLMVHQLLEKLCGSK